MLLRVIRDEPAPAPWNMGVDEALLALATVPTLRLYGWSPHAVSLGYFQRYADFADVPAGTGMVFAGVLGLFIGVRSIRRSS